MANDANTAPGRAAETLALVCLVGFWLLPFAPLAAIGAIKLTEGSAGWARRSAVAGALACAAYTLAMAVVIARLYLLIPA